MTTKQKLILTLLIGSQFMLSIDFTILNVALPALGRDLRLGAAELPWVSTAFALPSAGFTLLFGRLGDLLGRRRLFLAGLALLAAGSLAGGLAPSAGVLLGTRFAQGLAAALVIPSALSLLTTTFGEGPPRERALGLNGPRCPPGSSSVPCSAACSPTSCPGGGRSWSTSRSAS